MTNDEAKFILSAYRPGGHDASDPAFAEALEQARRDPALARWFEFERKFDELMTAKIAAVPPPPGLRDAILAGARVTETNAAPTVQPAWWRRPGSLAMAASVLVLLTVGLVTVWPNRVDAQQLRNFVLQDLGGPRHEGHGPGNDALQAQLGDSSRPLGAGVALDFEQMKASGCRVLRFQERELLEVCFKRDGRWFHCYIGRRSDFPGAARLGSAPEFQVVDKRQCVSWVDQENLYVVAGSAGLDALKRLL
jgi:hypothetical protein